MPKEYYVRTTAAAIRRETLSPAGCRPPSMVYINSTTNDPTIVRSSFVCEGPNKRAQELGEKRHFGMTVGRPALQLRLATLLLTTALASMSSSAVDNYLPASSPRRRSRHSHNSSYNLTCLIELADCPSKPHTSANLFSLRPFLGRTCTRENHVLLRSLSACHAQNTIPPT